MLSELYDIRFYLQDFIESISSISGLDVYLSDDNLMRVAGTSLFKETVGLSLPAGCATEHVLKSHTILAMYDPLENTICRRCPIKDNGCYKEYSINCPIMIGDKVYGCFSLAAISNEQKKRLVVKSKEYIDFTEKICAEIACRIEKNQLERKLNLIKTLVSEGLVVTDFKGNIITYNNKILDVFREYKNINAVLNIEQDKSFDSFLKKLEEGETEIEFNISSRNITMYVSAERISPHNEKSDILFVFKYKKELDNIAYKLLSEELTTRASSDDIKGNSGLILKIKGLAMQAAKYNSNILLLGESGTGKEVIAKYIHDSSDRKEKPFVAINCAAIPENLLESELFGYEAGAFTSAKKVGKPGKFEIANGGTIFLDEIGEMSLNLQPKLLRVIDQNKVERIGGVKLIELDIKIIAATNKDLEQMVDEDKFRKDLFYRLCVFPIVIPPLRNRPEDIIILAEWFLKKYNKKFRKNVLQIDDMVKRELLLYSWPGNVRELENAIEYSVNVETSNILRIDSIQNKYLRTNSSNEIEETDLKCIQKKYIKKLLSKHGNSLKGKEAIAKELGISLSTLYRHIKKYNL